MERTSSFCAVLCLLVCFICTSATLLDGQVVTKRTQRPVDMYERKCVLQGGVCRYADDCPSGQLTSIKGLCPTQQSLGVECCYTRRRLRRDTIDVCVGDNFCTPAGDCELLADQQGGCAGSSLCCRKRVYKPNCRWNLGGCFPANSPCATLIDGNFEDCEAHEKCCRLV